MKRLIVVYNQRSSNFCRVQKEVLDNLSGLNGCIIGKYSIKKTNFDDNVATLSKLLKDGDLVLVAGGDATAAIAVNAILKSSKSASISALPYGNFNDFARTIALDYGCNTGRMTAVGWNLRHAQPLGGHGGEGEQPVGPIQKHTYYPLAIFIDGKLWRYSACYVSIGMMAEATKIFDEPKIRRKLQKGHRRPWRSYFHLASWYFGNCHKDFIPSFVLNGHAQSKRTSDYFAINGASAAGIMKGGRDYKSSKNFVSSALHLKNPFRLFIFMVKSIFGCIPGGKTTQDLIEFSAPSAIAIQAEGEYKVFRNVHTVKIIKSNKQLTTFHFS